MKKLFDALKRVFFPPKITLDDTLRPDYKPIHMRVAEGELGVKETKGGNSRIEYYHSFTSLPKNLHKQETSWCSSFVCFVMSKVGIIHKNAAARSWLSVGMQVNGKPEYGDIVIFWRVRPDSWQGHVGFFVKQNEKDIYVLGGNQDNMVCIKKYSKKQLLGIRRVIY